MSGIDISRVVGMSEQDLDEFTCGICKDLFVDPKVTQCCLNTFCSNCITHWLRDHNTCPNDRRPLNGRNLSPAPRLVTNLLNNMKIKCDFEPNGCQTTVEMNKLSKHIDNCKYNPNKKICKNCGLREDRIFKHNCVENLKIRIDSLEIENKRLNTENSHLKREIEKHRPNNTNQFVFRFTGSTPLSASGDLLDPRLAAPEVLTAPESRRIVQRAGNRQTKPYFQIPMFF